MINLFVLSPTIMIAYYLGNMAGHHLKFSRTESRHCAIVHSLRLSYCIVTESMLTV